MTCSTTLVFILFSLLSQSRPISMATIVEICHDPDDANPDPTIAIEAAFKKLAGEDFVPSQVNRESMKKSIIS
jgi:hypothetical protein